MRNHAIPIEYAHFLCDSRVAFHEELSLPIQIQQVFYLVILSQAVECLVRYSFVNLRGLFAIFVKRII